MVVPCGSKCCESVIKSSRSSIGAAHWPFRPRGPGSGPGPLTGLLSRLERALALAAGSGMRGVVNAGEVLEVKMGVDLGRGDIGVTQELLDSAQLGAGLEQVRGEGV